MTTDPERDETSAATNTHARMRVPMDHPGALRNETWLTLQTRQAQRLVRGRSANDGKAAIIGLTRFSALVRQIWTGARAGDPYADWWLLKIHDALDQSKQDIEAIQRNVEFRLASISGIDIGVASSIEPVRVPLQFSHAYAFRGAYLVAAFDDAVRALLTARHVGLMSRDEAERLIAEAAHAVRRAFTSPTGYRFLGITRADVRQGTAQARQAAATMGVVPDAIINGEREAPYGPQTQGGFGGMNVRSVTGAPGTSDGIESELRDKLPGA